MSQERDITKYGPHVQQRYREYEDRPQRRKQFWDYVREVEKDRKDVRTCSDEELVEQYEAAILDSTRYSAVSAYGKDRDHLSEHNFVIMALAGERSFEVRDEMLRRMKR